MPIHILAELMDNGARANNVRSPLPLQDAIMLFRRLGVDVESMSAKDFALSYFSLAKRYHPDRNPVSHELMANINSARTTILRYYQARSAGQHEGRVTSRAFSATCPLGGGRRSRFGEV
jgi:DnaJ-class molecular chaperone